MAKPKADEKSKSVTDKTKPKTVTSTKQDQPAPKKEPAKVVPHRHDVPGHGMASSLFYAELVKISSWLFLGVLALMTYLLSVGLQHPKVKFSASLYTVFGSLALNIALYVIGYNLQLRAQYRGELCEEGDKTPEGRKSLEASHDSARNQLKMFRILQQVVFVVAIAAVVYFAVTAAQLFFALSAQQTR